MRNFDSRLLSQILLLALICLTLGLIDAVRSYLSAYYNGVFHLDFVTALRWDLSGWLVWLAFIPFILWLCKRIQFRKETWLRFLLFYLPLGIVLALTRTFFPVLPESILGGWNNVTLWMPDKFYVLMTDFLTACVFYIAVLGFGQALMYYKQFREEEVRSLRLEAQLSSAQLQALKMQLHPHFLFNALNSISALQMENAEKAQKMTARLGDFLRMTLENVGVQEITLKQEIEFLNCYLDIERVRFGEQLETRIDVAAGVGDCLVPNLILQPLVENAIRHGIVSQTEKGLIDITANHENGWLKVKIKDNGSGIIGGKVDEIFSSGVGLSNTRARLNQFYGDNFQFDIESQNGNGVLVTLCFPISTKN